MARIVMLLFLMLTAGCQKAPDPARQEAVAERGAEVMPFELDRSTHVFDKREDGGLQQVYSDDGDASEVALIRAHLQEIAGKFAAGDFHEPAMIHGHNMPGLHALAMGHEQLDISYSEIENGGQILYTSEETVLVEAIHHWFDAQLSDHGSHAQGHD
ncbi:MAG: aspartate carbamoyltransferase [Bacteroidota bacterium]